MQHYARAALVIAIFASIALISAGGILPSTRAPGESFAGLGTGPTSAVQPFNAPVSASLSVNPTSVQTGQSISVQTTASGGTTPYSYVYNGFPSGCGGSNSATFTCSPTSSGTFQLSVTVTDSLGNRTSSNTVSLSVTSSNGNGNGNGGSGGSGNNSSNPFSGFLSGIGGFLQLLLIFGIIGFATWILLIVGVWVIAIVLLRRLPKRGATASTAATEGTVPCAHCHASIPSGSKFCPECGASTGAPKSA